MTLQNVGLSPNYTDFKPQKTVLLIVGSGAHAASYPMGTGGSFSGGKMAGA
jgi:hypothetical protein